VGLGQSQLLVCCFALATLSILYNYLSRAGPQEKSTDGSQDTRWQQRSPEACSAGSTMLATMRQRQARDAQDLTTGLAKRQAQQAQDMAELQRHLEQEEVERQAMRERNSKLAENLAEVQRQLAQEQLQHQAMRERNSKQAQLIAELQRQLGASQTSGDEIARALAASMADCERLQAQIPRRNS